MFSHIFINRFKCMYRDRVSMFWTILFPLVLATLFSMAFSNIGKSQTFAGVEIAIVDNAEYQQNINFQKAISSASGKDVKSKMFLITFTTKQEAEDSLKKGDISGYVEFVNNTPQVFVKDSGIKQTILKGFVDHYLQMSSTYFTVLSSNPAVMQSIEQSSDGESYLTAVAPGKHEPNDILIYYFGLIAMASLYGGFWGMKEISAIQANISASGARMNMVPVHKLKIFGSSMCAASLMHLSSVFVLVGYMRFVLKVDFGGQLPYILLACIAGSLNGVSMGAMISALVKKNEGLKIAILISVSMLFSFLSGMMSADIKYLVTSALPFMAYINPANLVADAFYALYYYSTFNRYFLNIGLLFGFSILFYLVVFFVMRRQKYASL